MWVAICLHVRLFATGTGMHAVLMERGCGDDVLTPSLQAFVLSCASLRSTLPLQTFCPAGRHIFLSWEFHVPGERQRRHVVGSWSWSPCVAFSVLPASSHFDCPSVLHDLQSFCTTHCSEAHCRSRAPAEGALVRDGSRSSAVIWTVPPFTAAPHTFWRSSTHPAGFGAILLSCRPLAAVKGWQQRRTKLAFKVSATTSSARSSCWCRKNPGQSMAPSLAVDHLSQHQR